MSVHIIIQIKEILNEQLYDEYIAKVIPIIESFGGEYILKSDKIKPFSGGWNPKKIIVIRFQSEKDLNTCFQSEEYKVIKNIREQSTVGKALIIEE